jgi:hypothetical protein
MEAAEAGSAINDEDATATDAAAANRLAKRMIPPLGKCSGENG